MTESGFGAVSVVDDKKNVVGVFTDGDLRRHLKNDGKIVLSKLMSEFTYNEPVSVDGDALLFEASELFKKRKVDSIVVVENGKPLGMIDIQDLVKLNSIA